MTRETSSTIAALSERDAANYVGFSRHYLRVARRRGRGPAFIKIGTSIRYLLTDLDAWMDAHRVEPQEPAIAEQRNAER